MISSISGRELKIRAPYKAMSIILYGVEEICPERFRKKIGWNLCVKCFPITAL